MLLDPHELLKWSKYALTDEAWIFILSLCVAVPSWHLLYCDMCVPSPAATRLNSWNSAWRWHHDTKTCHCWQPAEQQAAWGARSSYVRWSKLPTTVENIRSVSSMLAPPLQNVPVMKFLILNVVCDVCHEALLLISSILSGAEKLNCTSLRGHDSLFPHSTPHPNYSVHSKPYKSWQTAWERSTLFIIQIHNVSILSVCTASADVQIVPQAQFHLPVWRILCWQVDDTRVEKANE